MKRPVACASIAQMVQQWRANPWRELALLFYIGMEICWLLPWYRLLVAADLQGITYLQVALVLGGIALAANSLARCLAFSDARPAVRRQVFGVFLLLCALVAVRTLINVEGVMSLAELVNNFNQTGADIRLPGELVAGAAALWVALRGMRSAEDGFGSMMIGAGFRLGMLMLVAYSLAAAGVGAPSISPAWLGGFFLLGLAALSLGRAAAVVRPRASAQTSFSFSRFFALFAMVTLIVVVALVLGSLASGGLVYTLLAAAYGGVVTAITALVAPIWVGILELFVKAPAIEAMRAMPTLAPEALEMVPAADPAPTTVMPPWVGVVFTWAVLLLLIVFIISRLQLKTRLIRRNPLVEVETLPAQSGANPLADVFRRWAAALQRRAQPSASLLRARQIYAELLALSLRRGAARDPAITPHEFIGTLQAMFPHSPEEIQRITALYQRVRYGEYPELAAEVSIVEADWSRLQQRESAR